MWTSPWAAAENHLFPPSFCLFCWECSGLGRGNVSNWSLLQVPVTHHLEDTVSAADSLRPNFPVILKVLGLTQLVVPLRLGILIGQEQTQEYLGKLKVVPVGKVAGRLESMVMWGQSDMNLRVLGVPVREEKIKTGDRFGHEPNLPSYAWGSSEEFLSVFLYC